MPDPVAIVNPAAAPAEDWGAQIARAEKLAAEAEAKGEIAAEYLDKTTEEPAEEAPAEEKPKAKKAEAKKPDAKDEKPEGEPEDKNVGKVTPEERANFRREKAKWREKRDAEVAQFRRELTEAKQKYGKLEEAAALFDAGDPIGAVEKLTGEKWNDVQKKAAARVKGADPRVDKLERELAAEREARAKAEAERAEREQKEAYSRERTQWMAGLKEELETSEDETIAKLAQSKLGFLDHVFQFQEQEYDPDDGATLTAAEAAERALPHWRSMYEELCEVFGDRPASKAEGSSNGAAHRKGSTSAKPGGKPPTTLSQRKAAEASPPEPKEFDEKKWLKKFSNMMRESRPE